MGILKKFINEFKNSKILLNASKIVSGTIVAQIISFITVTVNSRIYSPVDFGIFAAFTSFSSIAVGIANLGLMSAIVISDSDEDAKGISKLINYFTIISCIIFLLINIVIYNEIKIMPFKKNYFMYLTLLLILIVLNNYNTVMNIYINRLGRYNILILNPIIQTVVNFIISSVLGLTVIKEYGLILGSVFGTSGSIIYMRKKIGNNDYGLSFTNIKYIVRKYKLYLQYQYPTGIFNVFSSQLPNLLIANFFGEAVLGYYAMSQRLLAVPVSLIGSSLGKVFVKEASNKKNRGEDLGGFLYKHIKLVLILAIIPISILVASGDILLPFILGGNWIIAGKYVRILAFYYIFVFIMNSTEGLPSILNLQKMNMIFGFFSFTLNIVVVVVSSFIFNNNDLIMIGSIAVANSLIQIKFYSMMLNKTKMKSKRYLLLIFVSIISILIISFFIRVIINFFMNNSTFAV